MTKLTIPGDLHKNKKWLRDKYEGEQLTVWQIGKLIGVNGQIIAKWLKKHGIKARKCAFTKNVYTDAERSEIRLAYENAAKGNAPLDLKALADKLGREKTNISRFAKDVLGLTNKNRKQPATAEKNRAKWSVEMVEFLVKNYKALTYDKLSELLNISSEVIRKKLKELGLRKVDEGETIWTYNEHPKGMLGKTHNDEYKKELSRRAKAMWEDPDSYVNSEKHKQQVSDRAMIMQRAKTVTNPYSRTKSGKREDLGGMFFRSAWEANFARYLNLLKKSQNIFEWKYEEDTFEFPIKRGTRGYTPDFKVWDNENSTPYYYEVKGWMDDKSKTRLKRMEKYYPEIKLIVVDAKQYKAIARKCKFIIPNWE